MQNMELYNIEATAKTPYVNLNPKTGEMVLQGRSIPGDVDQFWSPILSWFYAYSYAPAKHTQVTVHLEYFNITTSKRLMYLLNKMHEMHQAGHSIKIDWLYYKNDEDMKEVGMDYSSLTKIPFNLVPVEEEMVLK